MSIPFFGSLFKKKEEKTKELSLEEFEKLLLAEEKKRFAVLERNAFSIFAQINYLLKETSLKIKKIDETEIDFEGAAQKILSTGKKDFVKQMESTVSKLVPPKEHSFEAIINYSSKSMFMLEAELVKAGKVIALTRHALAKEMKAVGDSLKELMETLRELNKKITESKMVPIKKMQKRAENIRKLENKVLVLKKESAGFEKEFLEKKNTLSELRKDVESLKNSQEAKELELLETQLKKVEEQQKETEFRTANAIAVAGKPLRKIEKLINAKKFFPGGYSGEELGTWLSNVSKAVKSDQKGEKIKSACKDALKAIDEGTISAKNEKEKEKWIQFLNEVILKNFFEEVFWNLNAQEVKRNEIKRKIDAISLSKKISEKKTAAEETEKILLEINSRKERTGFYQKEAEKEIIEETKKLSEEAEPVFGKTQIISCNSTTNPQKKPETEG
jgi:hypothetical protein